MTFQKISPNTKDLNINFIGGELAKSHWGNISAPFYNSSVKIAENMIGLASGGMRKRLGTILLEKSETEIVTYSWLNKDILFRKKDADAVEYKIFNGVIVVKDWTVLSGVAWSTVYDMTVILPRPNDMMLGTKNGLFKLDTTTYTLNLQTINNPDNKTITDFANAIIYNDALVTFDKGSVHNSSLANFTDFKPTSPMSNSGPAQTLIGVFAPHGNDIISTKSINNYIVVATTHGIYVVRQVIIDVSTPAVYYSVFIADYIAVKGGVLVIGGNIYIGTEDAVYTMGSDEFEQVTNSDGGNSKNNSYRSTTFKLYSITVFSEHVFMKDPASKMIAYTKRSVGNPDIIYGLRNDGVIICFALVQVLVKGGGLQAPITTRRTCKGIYNWVCPNNFATSVTVREVNGDKTNYFVEKEIYRNYCDDNQSTYAVSDYRELDKYLFLDCGYIANGIKGYTGLFKNSLLRVPKNTGFKAGDHILFVINGGRFVYGIDVIESASNNFFDFITLHSSGHNVPTLAEGKEYLIIGKLIGDSAKKTAEYTAYKTLTADIVGIQEFSHNLSHDGMLNHGMILPLNTFNYSTGIDYPAYLKFLHATITTKIERLSVGVTTLETQFTTARTSETGHGNDAGDIMEATNTTLGYTNYYEYTLPSISGYDTLKSEVSLRSAPGDNLIILNVSYLITKNTLQS